MLKEEKIRLVDELVEKINSNNSFYIADASGMNVEDTNAFRKMCHSKDIEYKVYKNTLIAKALERIDADFSQMNSALVGFSGILFAKETAKAPALLIKDFRKKGTRPSLKAAGIEKSAVYLGDESLELLTKLKSREELIGDIIGLLQSPAKNVISALQGGGHKLSGIVKTLSERNA